MPGILPMKVIKVGTSSQSRIAQACDRCRSKKIRCDGIRPTCSQCSNVGFECRTSDKLSRRAFPRGYTESLEERVRQLEAETRELKDLLDEKDEKIDMLSKMHGNRRGPSLSPAPVSPEARAEAHAAKEDTFRVQAAPLLLGVENSDSYFMGASSGRTFIEAFKRKLQEAGKPTTEFNPEAFLHIQGCESLGPKSSDLSMRIPPRLFSDRCVNVYFQEWAPLFPILHKPTFLHIYEEFVADPEKVKSNHKLAQLYLVFNIAGLSSDAPDLPQLAICEQQWRKALDAVLMENTMNTLQCLTLALLYCTMRADYKRLQHYKGIAIGLSHRLGLHQSQKRFSFGALTIETRKKVFWTLYTLDCFSAAILGLPKLLREEDIQAEYPADTDDEYVTEKGFQPTLPGEYTRLSSALALFRGTRILAKVLEKNYPASSSHDLSLQQMSALDAELDAWYDNLPAHLRLTFAQDKPSTDVTGSRSPLLALAYYYIRTLIYRPAVGSTLGPKAAHALISIGTSSKHIVQIMQLLEERSMTFSFCLNKTDLLVICGMTLLYQSIDLKQDSKLMLDDERLVNAVIKILGKSQAPGAVDLKRVASILITVEEPIGSPLRAASREASMSALSNRGSPPAGVPPKKKAAPYPFGQLPGAASSESDLIQQQEKLRRMTMPGGVGQRPEFYRARSRQSIDNLQAEVPMAHRDHRMSMSQIASTANHKSSPLSRPNLDFMSFGTPSGSQPPSPHQHRLHPQQGHPQQGQHQQSHPGMAQLSMNAGKNGNVSSTEWETLLGSLDGGLNNVYDAIYGGQALVNEASIAVSNCSDWPPDNWDLTGFSIDNPEPPQSVLSMSDESLSSGEEVGPSELGMSVGSIDYRNQMIPQQNGDGYMMDRMEASFPM
ncbi:fungal-specific transcription factor domain-containing protein [Dactylonectria estremocensis]|uniref:Fungal-specific transcription factor domain-containing protein n=1 Tax=Dactylonectria estremocensis TaxID=1079267 RepID=A0A9P9J9S0_9HYPO|nr:fungal-specific transcription factor domain-containing protein [Dactylonectria estremocensis]